MFQIKTDSIKQKETDSIKQKETGSIKQKETIPEITNQLPMPQPLLAQSVQGNGIVFAFDKKEKIDYNTKHRSK